MQGWGHTGGGARDAGTVEQRRALWRLRYAVASGRWQEGVAARESKAEDKPDSRTLGENSAPGTGQSTVGVHYSAASGEPALSVDLLWTASGIRPRAPGSDLSAGICGSAGRQGGTESGKRESGFGRHEDGDEDEDAWMRPLTGIEALSSQPSINGRDSVGCMLAYLRCLHAARNVLRSGGAQCAATTPRNPPPPQECQQQETPSQGPVLEFIEIMADVSRRLVQLGDKMVCDSRLPTGQVKLPRCIAMARLIQECKRHVVSLSEEMPAARLAEDVAEYDTVHAELLDSVHGLSRLCRLIRSVFSDGVKLSVSHWLQEPTRRAAMARVYRKGTTATAAVRHSRRGSASVGTTSSQRGGPRAGAVAESSAGAAARGGEHVNGDVAGYVEQAVFSCSRRAMEFKQQGAMSSVGVSGHTEELMSAVLSPLVAEVFQGVTNSSRSGEGKHSEDSINHTIVSDGADMLHASWLGTLSGFCDVALAAVPDMSREGGVQLFNDLCALHRFFVFLVSELHAAPSVGGTPMPFDGQESLNHTVEMQRIEGIVRVVTAHTPALQNLSALLAGIPDSTFSDEELHAWVAKRKDVRSGGCPGGALCSAWRVLCCCMPNGRASSQVVPVPRDGSMSPSTPTHTNANGHTNNSGRDDAVQDRDDSTNNFSSVLFDSVDDGELEMFSSALTEPAHSEAFGLTGDLVAGDGTAQQPGGSNDQRMAIVGGVLPSTPPGMSATRPLQTPASAYGLSPQKSARGVRRVAPVPTRLEFDDADGDGGDTRA